MDQVVTARGGRTVVIDRDVGDVARQLKEIDRSLLLRWHEPTSHYSVVQVLPDESEQLVATCQPIAGGSPDPRLVEAVRKVASSAYDVEAELRGLHARQVRDQAHLDRERVGPALEQAYHRFQKQTGAQDRIFVPRGVR